MKNKFKLYALLFGSFSHQLRKVVSMWKRTTKLAYVFGAWLVLMLGATTAHADMMGLNISFQDFGTDSTVINDTDDDGQIKLGTVNASPHSRYGIEAIDPTKPIVIMKATATSMSLILTNIKITANDDEISGTIVFSGTWTHIAGSGTMTVAVGGMFGAGNEMDTTIPDSYSVTLVGEIGAKMLTVGPLTGPKVPRMGEPFSDSKSQAITLGAGADVVKATLSFKLDRVGSTLTFPNSADTLAEIPEPATILLFGTGLAGVAIKTRKRLKSRKDRQGS